MQQSGDKKDTAQKEALKYELDPRRDMQLVMPEDALVVNPYTPNANFVEREEQFSIRGMRGYILFKIAGAATYYNPDHTVVFSQITVWKRNPYRAGVERMREQGLIVPGSDESEMRKQRFQLAWGYEPKTHSTNDVQLVLDAMKEFIHSNECINEARRVVYNEFISWLMAYKAGRVHGLCPWVLEEDKKSIISLPGDGPGRISYPV